MSNNNTTTNSGSSSSGNINLNTINVTNTNMNGTNSYSPNGGISLNNRENFIHEQLRALLVPDDRELALKELVSKRDSISDLGVLLWNGYGIIPSLLQDIISIYPLFNTVNNLTVRIVSRVCYAISLLKTVAENKQTQKDFVNAKIINYLLPFLECRNDPEVLLEYLKLTSLGVIGGLVKDCDSSIILTLLPTNIVPKCLEIIKQSNDYSKILSSYIFLKIISNPNGLEYISFDSRRLKIINENFVDVLQKLTSEHPQNTLLLKHIFKCYIIMIENTKDKTLFRDNLSKILLSEKISSIVGLDQRLKTLYHKLLGLLQ